MAFRKYLLRSVYFWIGALFALIGLPTLLAGLGQTLAASDLLNGGRETEGTVLAVRPAGSAPKPSLVRYSFRDAAGIEVEREALVRADAAKGLRAGAAVRVRHHSTESWRSVLPGFEIAEPDGRGVIALGGAFLGLGLLAYGAAHRRAHRASRLFRRGSFARGRITAVEEDRQTTINNRHPKFLRFTFTAGEDGKIYLGKSQNIPFRDEGWWQAGGEVIVAYNPRQPEEHEPDLFGFSAGRGPARL